MVRDNKSDLLIDPTWLVMARASLERIPKAWNCITSAARVKYAGVAKWFAERLQGILGAVAICFRFELGTMMQRSIAEAAKALYRNAAAVRAVEGREVNQFTRALEALERLADAIDAPLALVGGLAGIHHRALVTTLDIDIVVPGDKLDAVVEGAVHCGLVVKRASPDGWHRLAFVDEQGEVAIEVVPAGQKSPRDPVYAPPTPSPQVLGVERGLGYASFAGWVALKLVANRDKDRYHLIEALKQASETDIASVVLRLRSLDPSYLKEFQRLVESAEAENQENW
jgi:hypothetical protein